MFLRYFANDFQTVPGAPIIYYYHFCFYIIIIIIIIIITTIIIIIIVMLVIPSLRLIRTDCPYWFESRRKDPEGSVFSRYCICALYLIAYCVPDLGARITERQSSYIHTEHMCQSSQLLLTVAF